jgi:hypothetical protein
MRFHAELYPLICLKDFNDLDDVAGPRVAARARKRWRSSDAFAKLLFLE